MPEPTTAAVVTPSPAPTAPAPEPSPQPAAAQPAATPQPSETPKWQQMVDDIESAPEATPAEKPTELAARTPEKAGAKTAEKLPEKPATPAPEIPAFQTPKQLREWAKSRDAAAKSYESKIQQLESQLAELKNVVPRTQQESQLLNTTIAEQKKTIEEYEAMLAKHVFESSPRFNREFKKPFENAMQYAFSKMSELTVRQESGETDDEGKPKFKEREATKDDFLYIYRLPPRQARSEAKRMFGEDWPEVMRQREKVDQLAIDANKALEENRNNYKADLERAQAEEVSKRSSQDQLWKKVNDAISADPKHKDDWGTPTDDPEAAEALKKGFAFADLFFSEKPDKYKPEEKIELDAHVRHIIAAHPRLKLDNRRLRTRNSELESENSALRGSEPGKPAPSPDKPKVGEKGVMEALEELPD